jgi:hypothetical protein
MHAKLAVGLTLAVLLLAPAPAEAVPLGKEVDGQVLPGSVLSVSNDFYFKFNTFIDEEPGDSVAAPLRFVEMVNRFSADLQIKRLSLGAQVDTIGIAPQCTDSGYADEFAEAFGEDTPCATPNPIFGAGWDDQIGNSVMVRLEKVWARYSSKNLDVWLGDYYAAFGRGILLSMTKKPEVDQDNSLLGARVDLRTKPLDFTFLLGTPNPQEVSMELRNKNIRRFEPTMLAGGLLKLRPHKQVELTVQGVGYELTERPSLGAGGSLSLNGLGGAVDVYFEGNGFAYGTDENAGENSVDPTTGHALYGAVTAYTGPVTLTVEGKRYKDAQVLKRDGPIVPVQYNAPPSLEWELSTTEDSFTTISSNDVAGWRVSAELFLLNSFTTVGLAFTNSFDLEPHPPYSVQREVGFSPVLTLDQPIHFEKVDLHLKGHVGYRHDVPLRTPSELFPEEQREVKSTEYLRHNSLLHFSVDFGVTIGPVALEWVTWYRRYAYTLDEPGFCLDSDNPDECSPNDGWISMENAFSVTLLGKYTAALHLDFTDDPIVQRQTNDGSPGNLRYDSDFKSSAYIGGSLILKPVSNLEVNIFVGGQKAGVVCTGGACRTVPAFNGAKARVIVNF